MPFSHRLGPYLTVFVLVLAGTFGLASPAFAQAPAKKVAEPEDISVTTKDGVKIMATYLASSKGKDAAVCILLHGFKGNRRDMDSLGAYLQKNEVAVVMPDLRGHGDSTTVTVGGVDRKFEAATMPVAQLKLMSNDLEAIKKFLMEKNNAAELNIERLGIVAAEMSVPIAVNWTVDDWSWPILPNLKQGQDVKALALLSPQMTFKTLNMSPAITVPSSPVRDKISLLLIAGAEDDTSVRDATRIEQMFARIRPKVDKDKIADKTLFIDVSIKTKLVGTKLLGEANLGVEDLIWQFVELRLVDPSFPWKERQTP
jgi:alpha-beta hydrolase superfamily lysophospholipase